MSNDKNELIVMWGRLRAQAQEMELCVPPRVAAKLRQNAELMPSKYDFRSDYEEKYRLELNDISVYPECATLIDEMRNVRQRISNVEFEAEQTNWPYNTMTA